MFGVFRLYTRITATVVVLHAKLIHFANQPKLFPSVMNGHGEVACADHACLW